MSLSTHKVNKLTVYQKWLEITQGNNNGDASNSQIHEFLDFLKEKESLHKKLSKHEPFDDSNLVEKINILSSKISENLDYVKDTVNDNQKLMNIFQNSALPQGLKDFIDEVSSRQSAKIDVPDSIQMVHQIDEYLLSISKMFSNKEYKDCYETVCIAEVVNFFEQNKKDYSLYKRSLLSLIYIMLSYVRTLFVVSWINPEHAQQAEYDRKIKYLFGVN